MNSSADLWRERGRLSARLRHARILAGRTQKQAHALLGWPLSKLLDIECGRSAPSIDDLRLLVKVYGVADPGELQQLARRTAGLPRDAFRDVYPVPEQRFVNAQGNASRIRQYELNLIPEVLRTEAYAQAVIDSIAPERRPRSLRERMLYAGMARQMRLDRDRPPEQVYLIDEQALRRPVGGPMVMAEQVRRLHEVAAGGSALRVVPASGVHPGLAGAFTILDGPSGVVYLTDQGHRLLVAADQVARYEQLFARLFDEAAPLSSRPEARSAA